MSNIVPIRATLCSVGLGRVAAAVAGNTAAKISHIALGTGGTTVNGGPVGYQPTGAEISLRAETTRNPVAAARQIGAREWMVEAAAPNLAAGAAPQWITEVAAFLDDGTILGIWSRDTGPLFARTDISTGLIGFTIAFDELPEGSVTVVGVGAPSVNLSVFSYVAASAGAIIELQRRAFEGVSLVHQAEWLAQVRAV